MKKAVYLISLVLFLLTGCDDLDRSYEDMVPPEIPSQYPSVFGIITKKSGTPVQDAVVQVGELTAKTGSSGIYYFRHVTPGSYPVSVKASGMTDIESTITVPEAEGRIVRCIPFNAVLASSGSIVKKDMKAASGGSLITAAESLSGNDKARISLELVIPENALTQDATLSLEPLYDTSFLSDGNGMLVGARLEGGTFRSTATLSFTLDEELADLGFVMKQTNGQWAKVASIHAKGVVSVEVSEEGNYGFFVPMTFTEKTSQKGISFTENVWDNIRGGSWRPVYQANYSYMTGAEMPASGKSILSALLKERLAATYGAINNEIPDSCLLNVTLPVGVRLSVSGLQETRKVTLTAGSTNVTCTSYGSVSIQGKAVDREDTGGSN